VSKWITWAGCRWMRRRR